MTHEIEDLLEIKSNWQSQKTNLEEIRMETIIKRSEDFNHKINIRNSLEWFAALLVAPIFAYRSLEAESFWSHIMNLEIAIASIFIAFHLYYRGRNDKKPDFNASTKEFVLYQKRQIQRQIELLSNIRYWYVLPLMFGLVGLTLERIIRNWNPSSPPMDTIIYLFAIIGLGIGATWINEVKAVRELKHKLEGLKSLE